MDPRLFNTYFQKGFVDGLEKLAASEAKLEKQAAERPNFGSRIGDAFEQGVANAIVRGSAHVIGMGVKGLARNVMGNKLRGRHKEFLARLMVSDSILKSRPKDRVISHYQTMVRVSPSISLDRNVVASFLRESTAYESMSTVTVKSLIDLEKTMAETASKKNDATQGFLNKL